MHSPDLGRKEKVDMVSAKQRQSPLSSWIGKQLLGQKIPKTEEEQKALIKSTHAEIHHQGHTKVHHVLYPLYYWPGMDAIIEAVCMACARCIRASVPGNHEAHHFLAWSAG